MLKNMSKSADVKSITPPPLSWINWNFGCYKINEEHETWQKCEKTTVVRSRVSCQKRITATVIMHFFLVKQYQIAGSREYLSRIADWETSGQKDLTCKFYNHQRFCSSETPV